MTDALQLRSRFIRHGPCEKCGSKDNVAWYSNGTGFCFGCGALYKDHDLQKEATRSILSGQHSGAARDDSKVSSSDNTGHRLSVATGEKGIRPPPDDITTLFAPAVVAWFEKYHLTPADLLRHNVVWSPKREQLFFQFFGESPKDLVLWQARNFREGTSHKDRFFTSGLPNEVVAVYYPREKTRVGAAVVVEDCVSGIKVAQSGYSGVPCFGSGMSDRKLRRLAGLYRHIIFWLDHDKFKEAQTLARKVGMMGVKTSMMYTEEDPKCFSTKEIQEAIDVKTGYGG